MQWIQCCWRTTLSIFRKGLVLLTIWCMWTQLSYQISHLASVETLQLESLMRMISIRLMNSFPCEVVTVNMSCRLFDFLLTKHAAQFRYVPAWFSVCFCLLFRDFLRRKRVLFQNRLHKYQNCSSLQIVLCRWGFDQWSNSHGEKMLGQKGGLNRTCIHLVAEKKLQISFGVF